MSIDKDGEKKQKKMKVPIGKSVGSANNSSQLWSVGSAAPNSGVNKTAAYNTTQSPSFFYSPELTSESWVLPKSRQEILKWCRIFFNLETVIQSTIKMHARYPFSKFDIITSDPSVTEFYKEMAFNDKFNLYDFILQASLSFRKFGEAIPFGNQVSFRGEDGKTYYKWDKFILLEPELVEVKQDVWGGSPQFELIPTEDMKKSAEKILRGDDPALDTLRSQIPSAILAALQQGKNIPLDPDHVSLLADITDPSATRGTPQIQCCFKVLIYQDWIRLAQTAIAQRYHFPVEIWKIGDLSHDPPIIPTEAQLTQWRNLINQSIQNPPFSIVAPPIVNYEAVSTHGKLLPIAPEYEYILDQLFIGMGVSKSLLTGEGPCLDESSRIVTKEGPKYFFELTYKDEIATFNPDTEELEYHRPTKIFKQLYSGNMIHFKSSKVDHVVSPEHECWVRNGVSDWKKVKAKDVAKSSRMRMHMKWQGNEPPKKVSLGGKKLSISTYLEFIGCWINHGWLRYNTKEEDYQVGLPSTGRALEVTKKLPFAGKWTVSNKTPVLTKDVPVSWVVTDKQLAEELLFSCGDGFTVGIPEWVKNLKREYLELFLSKFSPDLKFCIVSSPRLADDLVEVAIKCGYAPSVDRGEWGYKINFEAGETFLLNQKAFKKQEPYMGVIWCVDVPNHIFLSERNGKYVLTGNSFSNTKTMALHRLMMEYKAIRDKFEEWMIHKYFRPIAEKNNFYYTENGRRKLILPQISWYKSLDIEEEQAEKDQYLKLHKEGYISTRTLFSKFPNLDFDVERKHLEEEKGTVWDKAKGERLPETFTPSGDSGSGGSGAAVLDLPEPVEPSMPEEPTELPTEGPVEEAPAMEAPVAPEV